MKTGRSWFVMLEPAANHTIRRWSSGAVTTAKILDHETESFDAEGLFSEPIFGPVSDWQCRCGKLRGETDADVVCDECRVQLGSRQLRQQRFGHIELALPIQHPWLRGRGLGMLTTIPVIPAGLRRVSLSPDGRLRKDSITRCYRRILKRNRKLSQVAARYDECTREVPSAPAVRRRWYRLQRAIARLFFELLHQGSPASNRYGIAAAQWPETAPPGARPWPGWRVENSARAPVVPDPKLGLHQCGLPREMLRWLLRLRLSTHLASGNHRSFDQARQLVDTDQAVAQSLFEAWIGWFQVVFSWQSAEHPQVVGLQAGCVGDQAIHVHPSVAERMQGAFDGSEPVVALPLARESWSDADRLRFPNVPLNELANTARSSLVPEEAVVGCLMATWDLSRGREATSSERTSQLPIFGDVDELRRSWESGRLRYDSPVAWRLRDGQQLLDVSLYFGPHDPDQQLRRTTAGRVLLNAELPEGLPFYDLPCCHLTCAYIIAQIADIEAAQRTIEALTRFGFAVVTRAGASLAVGDFKPPRRKAELLATARERIATLYRMHQEQSISDSKLQHQSYAYWWATQHQVWQAVTKELDQGDSDLAILAAKVRAGTDLTLRQIHRLTGMVGCVRESSQLPVLSSYGQGLRHHEYFTTTRQMRKDRWLEIARAGQADRLRRRLANAGRNVVVTSDDCGSPEGVLKQGRDRRFRFGQSLADLITGRVSCESLVDPISDNPLVSTNELITAEIAQRLVNCGVAELRVRSPVTCRAERGVCQLCYGADTTTGTLVAAGTAVGIRAATRVGGALFGLRPGGWYPIPFPSDQYGKLAAQRSGTVSLKRVTAAVNQEGNLVVVSTGGALELLDDQQRVIDRYPVPHGAVLHVPAGSVVRPADELASWSVEGQPLYASAAGQLRWEDLVPGRNVMVHESQPGRVSWTVLASHSRLRPRLRVEDGYGNTSTYYFLPVGARITAVDLQHVEPGTLLAEAPALTGPEGDRSLGCDRVAELFSARRPGRAAVLAKTDGQVQLSGTDEHGRVSISVSPGGDRSDWPPEIHRVQTGLSRQVIVQNDQFVKAGQPLTNGDVSPHDVLRVCGLPGTADYLLTELQKCFCGQQSPIFVADRDLEIFLGQMLSYVRVTSPGDTVLERGTIVKRQSILARNQRLHQLVKVEDPANAPIPAGKLLPVGLFNVFQQREESAGGQSPTATRPWPGGWASLLIGIDQVAERSSSCLTSDGFHPTRQALVRTALAGTAQRCDQVKDAALLGEFTPLGSCWPGNNNR